MVNLNFDKFNEVQKKHQSQYLGSTKKKNDGFNTDDYNTQDNTDKSIGAAGRDI